MFNAPLELLRLNSLPHMPEPWQSSRLRMDSTEEARLGFASAGRSNGSNGRRVKKCSMLNREELSKTLMVI